MQASKFRHQTTIVGAIVVGTLDDRCSFCGCIALNLLNQRCSKFFLGSIPAIFNHGHV